KRSYETFPREKFLQTFELTAFDSANAQDDLLVLMVKAYAATLGRSLYAITRWVEKTPANRNHVSAIVDRFPNAKILITLRDPRAILAAQIALEKTRQTGRFSTYYVIAHWRVAAKLARRVRHAEVPGLIVPYERLVPQTPPTIGKNSPHLPLTFSPTPTLTPAKVGHFLDGNY